MKKILTLALALVLVFAIAAPAMAITNDTVDPDEVTPVDFVSVGVALFEGNVVSNIGFNLSQVASNKAYVADQVAYWGVALDFIAPAAGEERNMSSADYLNATLKVSSDAVTFSSVNAYESINLGDYYKLPADRFALDTAKNTIKNTSVAPSDTAYFGDNDVTVRLFGSAVVKKQGVVKAELYVNQLLPITIYNGTTELYDVTEAGWGYEVAAPSGNAVQFVLGTGTRAGKVDEIQVVWGGTTYKVAYGATYGSTLAPKTAAKALLRDGKVYDIAVTDPTAEGYLADSAKMFAFYEKVMAFFGFNPALDGYLRDGHFEAKASGLYMKDEVAVQLFTGSIVVPGDVVPPKTGDAASIVGFVMIAVAMIAAGVVVSRKVRA
jgi:hypothetical protein